VSAVLVARISSSTTGELTVSLPPLKKPSDAQLA
jgi:hypothetical protein